MNTPVRPVPDDTRSAEQRVEDLAFENRIRVLTEQRRWDELRLLLVIYGSSLYERLDQPPTDA